MRIQLLYMVLLGVICANIEPSIARTADLPPEIVAFSKQADAMAAALAAQVATCVVRNDTDNPVFHGCIDWHSSVHGNWALVEYTEATGDRRYVGLIKTAITSAGIKQEQTHLDADPSFEMPYGRAWFLRLAIDYQRVFHDDLLTPFADDLAQSLRKFYSDTPPNPESREYQNASWAMINMLDYAAARHDEALAEFVRDQVRRYFVHYDQPCPIARENVEWPDFMGVCTNWGWLVGRVIPHDQYAQWINGFIPQNEVITPITNPLNAHQNGLDFSRAWGFWGIYSESGDARFARAYLESFNAAYQRPEFWRGPYRMVGHWVAQFGMYALMPMFAIRDQAPPSK